MNDRSLRLDARYSGLIARHSQRPPWAVDVDGRKAVRCGSWPKMRDGADMDFGRIQDANTNTAVGVRKGTISLYNAVPCNYWIRRLQSGLGAEPRGCYFTSI